MNPFDAVQIINLLAALANVPAGNVELSQLRSLHDVGDQIVRCYHPTATYKDVRFLENPWSKGKEWRADSSALLSIQYRGRISKLMHTMDVAVMQRGQHIRATILKETNLIPAKKECALRDWVNAPPNEPPKPK